MEIKITKLLKRKNKSIYAMAKHAGIAYSTAYSIAHGKSNSIRFDVLGKICDFLDEPVDKIIVCSKQN